VFEDNFHKLNTEAGYDDKRLKTEYISAICKGYTNKFDCIIFATVELGKQLMHEKPQNASAIKETAALEYDSNLILFLWNSLNSARNKDPLTFPSNVLHYNKDLDHYVLKPATKPIIEVLILKNKLSEFKSSLYFELHPELAIYKEKTRAGMEELFPDGWGDK
jgi:hypothetical protein